MPAHDMELFVRFGPHMHDWSLRKPQAARVEGGHRKSVAAVLARSIRQPRTGRDADATFLEFAAPLDGCRSASLRIDIFQMPLLEL
jgi:hypothetical protein